MTEIENFLSELTELSKKYNLWLDSCGCCDSIAVEKIGRNKEGRVTYFKVAQYLRPEPDSLTYRYDLR